MLIQFHIFLLKDVVFLIELSIIPLEFIFFGLQFSDLILVMGQGLFELSVHLNQLIDLFQSFFVAILKGILGDT